MAEVVAEQGTDLVRTRVLAVGGDRFDWYRYPGPAAPRGHAALGEAVRDSIRSLPRGPVVAALREPSGAGSCYSVSGPVSAAALLSSGNPAAPKVLEQVLGALGGFLSQLHALPVPDEELPGALGPQRLGSWLQAQEGPGAAARLYEVCRRRWGRQRLGTLQGWLHSPVPRGQERLLHGAVSLGTTVPPARDGRAALLTGEDLCTGVPEQDLGWLLGELRELALVSSRGMGGSSALDYASLESALLTGYGAGPSPELLGRFVLLRVATHMHDYAAYVGWHDDLSRYADLFAELFDAGPEAGGAPAGGSRISLARRRAPGRTGET